MFEAFMYLISFGYPAPYKDQTDLEADFYF